MRTVCRTCLASSVKLLPLQTIPQTDIFERLTKMQMSNAAHFFQFNIDGRPTAICNECLKHLQTCSDFCDMANRSEHIFKELLAKGLETSPENINKLNQQIQQPPSASSVPSTTIDTQSQSWSITEEVTIEMVKEEPFWETEDEKSAKADELSVNKEITPVNEGIIPVNEGIIPVNEGIIPVNEAIIPVKDDTKPKKDKISVTVKRLPPAAHPKPYICDVCDKCFRWKEYLVNHLRIHREKLFSCNICHKHFIDSYRLSAHMIVHNEENPYVCGICDKAFTQNSALDRHMRIHTGEKPYGCTECGERFSQKSTLIAHVRIHSGEKPYPCQSCSKRFGKKSTLVRHMKVHTGEKPYVCNKCGKKYTRKSGMEKHKKICSTV